MHGKAFEVVNTDDGLKVVSTDVLSVTEHTFRVRGNIGGKMRLPLVRWDKTPELAAQRYLDSITIREEYLARELRRATELRGMAEVLCNNLRLGD